MTSRHLQNSLQPRYTHSGRVDQCLIDIYSRHSCHASFTACCLVFVHGTSHERHSVSLSCRKIALFGPVCENNPPIVVKCKEMIDYRISDRINWPQILWWCDLSCYHGMKYSHPFTPFWFCGHFRRYYCWYYEFLGTDITWHMRSKNTDLEIYLYNPTAEYTT